MNEWAIAVLVALTLLSGGGWVFTATAPNGVQVLTPSTIVAGLGVAGTTADRRVIDVAKVTPFGADHQGRARLARGCRPPARG